VVDPRNLDLSWYVALALALGAASLIFLLDVGWLYVRWGLDWDPRPPERLWIGHVVLAAMALGVVIHGHYDRGHGEQLLEREWAVRLRGDTEDWGHARFGISAAGVLCGYLFDAPPWPGGRRALPPEAHDPPEWPRSTSTASGSS
jgi:hypothetical protein